MGGPEVRTDLRTRGTGASHRRDARPRCCQCEECRCPRSSDVSGESINNVSISEPSPGAGSPSVNRSPPLRVRQSFADPLREGHPWWHHAPGFAGGRRSRARTGSRCGLAAISAPDGDFRPTVIRGSARTGASRRPDANRTRGRRKPLSTPRSHTASISPGSDSTTNPIMVLTSPPRW